MTLHGATMETAEKYFMPTATGAECTLRGLE
jgi:hypothetical protein